MNKHTPWPWNVSQADHASEVRGGDFDVVVAYVPHDADAHLIAAAPDLLVALEKITAHVEDFDTYELPPQVNKNNVLMRAHAAIAKARGKG